MVNKSDTLYNTTIRVSKTVFPIYNKNKAKWGGVGYEEVEIPVSEMIADISQGYAFSGCYGQPSVFTQKDKTKKNFTHTSVIAFDLDDSPVGMEETISAIEMKPSFAYTTPNHGKKGNRFRLIYVLSKPVDGHEYERNYDHFRQGMCADRCMRNYTQTIGGTIPTAQWWYGEDIYEPIPADVVAEKGEPEKKKRTKKEWATDADNKYVGRNDCQLSKQYCDDYFGLSPVDFLEKYKDTYEYFCASKLEYNEGYALLGDDYYEIRRRWHVEKNQNRNASVVDSLKDGMNRRRMLYTAGIIMRRIMPEITIEHLLYNLVYERTYYYDNSDKVLNNKRLLITAQNVIKTENIRMKSNEKRRFKIDKKYWSEAGLTSRQAVAIVSRELRWKEIAEHYNPDLTDKENVEQMKEAGLKVSVSTLKRWRMDNGLAKYNKKAPETETSDKDFSPTDEPVRAINSWMQGNSATVSAWEVPHTYPEYDRVDSIQNFLLMLDVFVNNNEEEKDENKFYSDLSLCYCYAFWESIFGG
ncbi:MAG: hypothetical protein LUD72_06435 [Bacteroidales bacterium]|nr:hypothetical protein [Bacteroidales bacterium]